MDGHIAAPRFKSRMYQGKYSQWASQLDADVLEALLWAVGEFGTRFNSAKRSIGSLAGPEFYQTNMAESRMRGALDTIATIQSGAQIEWHFPSGWDQEFSSEIPAFVPEYRERLLRGEQTAWAGNLDARSLALLLWMVGEYGIRANSSRGPGDSEYPPPVFYTDPENERVMRAVLRLIAKIEGGGQFHLEMAKQFIATEHFGDDG